MLTKGEDRLFVPDLDINISLDDLCRNALTDQ